MEYCIYCLRQRGERFTCCGESDFATYEELDDEAKIALREDEAHSRAINELTERLLYEENPHEVEQ